MLNSETGRNDKELRMSRRISLLRCMIQNLRGTDLTLPINNLLYIELEKTMSAYVI